MAELSGSMNGKLRPVAAAGRVGICPVIQQDVHTCLVTLLGGNQQWRSHISCLGVHIGTLSQKQNQTEFITHSFLFDY